jgi:hypothetical protein
VGDFKLLVGYPGWDEHYSLPNNQPVSPDTQLHWGVCAKHCLFDVGPGEGRRTQPQQPQRRREGWIRVNQVARGGGWSQVTTSRSSTTSAPTPLTPAPCRPCSSVSGSSPTPRARSWRIRCS